MSSNPFSQFNNMTTNTYKNMNTNMNNFNDAFSHQQNMIPKMNYDNTNNYRHNNLKKTVLKENIVEYQIHIDSIDRDIGSFTDPFHYVVHFNPKSTGTVKIKNKDGTVTQTRYKGTPKPHISRAFTNVKYIKIDNICLPRYKIIKKNAGEEKYDSFETTDDSNLYDDRFVELRITELEDVKTYATNTHSQNSFGLIFPDKLISSSFYLGAPFYAQHTYNDSLLGNITKLSIDFYDSYGEPLKITSVDSDGINPNSDPYDDVVTIDPESLDDPSVSVLQTDLRHPLNKKTQNYISLRIGVVECEHNLETQYAR